MRKVMLLPDLSPLPSGQSRPSGGSGFSCAHVGEYGGHGNCVKLWCMPGTRKRCKLLFEVSRTPLCQLPQYMVHYITSVRQAASARFIELQEEE